MLHSFNVTTIWMEHKDGTKFYQVFTVESNDSRKHKAGVFHYGPMHSGGAKGERRPVNGGSVSVVNAKKIAKKIADKIKFSEYRPGIPKTSHYIGRDLIHLFGAAKTDELCLEMFGSATPFSLDAKQEPSNESDNSVLEGSAAAVLEVRSEGWGSW